MNEQNLEYEDELENCDCDCDNINYPALSYDPSEDELKEGIKEGSNLLGFIGVINKIGLSENSILEIIRSKMEIDAGIKLQQMQIEYGVKICKDKDDDTEVKSI